MQVTDQPVVIEIVLVREQRPAPAPHPLVRQVELARCFQASAPVAETRRVLKRFLVQLKNTRGANAVGAVEQPLSPLALQQGALLGGDHGREGEVVIGSERPVIRNRHPQPVDRAAAEHRRQHPGFAFHRRIGRRHVRHIGQWHAAEFEQRILEIDHLLVLVVNDTCRPDLPFRRPLRILHARLAGGVDAIVEHGEIAGALRARRRETGLLGRVEPQRVDEAVAIIIAQVHDFAVGDGAVGLGQLHVSFGVQALGFLIVDHPVGFEGGTAKVELNVSDRRDALVGVVVVDLLGAHEHLLLRTLLPHDRFRPRREHQQLSRRRRHGAGARKQREGGRKNDQRAPRRAAARQSRTVGSACHHPSSW